MNKSGRKIKQSGNRKNRKIYVICPVTSKKIKRRMHVILSERVWMEMFRGVFCGLLGGDHYFSNELIDIYRVDVRL